MILAFILTSLVDALALNPFTNNSLWNPVDLIVGIPICHPAI